MRKKSIVNAVVISFLSCFLLFVVCEAGIRVYSALFFPKLMQLDSQLGWKHTPNVQKNFVNEYGLKNLVIQNQDGHRGTFYPRKRTNQKYRVLVLGDSFTEGVQVGEQELFTAQIEKINNNMEVINAGVGGYGTVQEYLFFQEEGVKYNPDTVVLMFYNNDLDDNCLTHYPAFGPRPFATLDGDRIRVVETFVYSDFQKFALRVPFWRTLNRHSYFYNFVNTRIYQRLMADRMREYSRADLKNIEDCGKYKIFFSIIEKIRDLATEIDAKFILVLIPSKEEVSSGYSSLQKPIIDFCRNKEIFCYPLINRLKAETDQGKEPYFPKDIHWTRAGHEIVAEEVAKLVRIQHQSLNN